eukprot:6159-Heterococcus_DN1.PRE.2
MTRHLRLTSTLLMLLSPEALQMLLALLEMADSKDRRGPTSTTAALLLLLSAAARKEVCAVFSAS